MSKWQRKSMTQQRMQVDPVTQSAWQRGQKASEAGLPAAANPHRPSEEEWDIWNAAWLETEGPFYVVRK